MDGRGVGMSDGRPREDGFARRVEGLRRRTGDLLRDIGATAPPRDRDPVERHVREALEQLRSAEREIKEIARA